MVNGTPRKLGSRLVVTILTAMVLQFNCSAAEFANGMKIGEVSGTTANVWTRLTEHASALHKDGSYNFLPKKDKQSDPLPWIVPGTDGEVQLHYWPSSQPDKTQKSAWTSVDPEKDFTHTFQITKLNPGTIYQLEIKSRENKSSESAKNIRGSFTTAPSASSIAPVTFNVITGQGFHRRDTPEGHQIYKSMLQNSPSFLVHTGDVLYYDKPQPYAKTKALARYKWNRIYALPLLTNFHKQVSCYYLKDDHDILKNDCWPGQSYGDLTFADGQEIYQEQTTFPLGLPYRTRRWGKHVQIWLMEGRDFRTPNNLKNPAERTIWGDDQIEWLKKSLAASDATFKFIISPTPIVGPDRTKGKNDNHANASHKLEGDVVRKLISSFPNTHVLCGDRHWQYASVDSTTGLHEFSCGPTSDIHARGYSLKERTEIHRYLKICGGFLSVSVSDDSGKAQAKIQHHSVAGKVLYSKTFTHDLQ